MRLGLLAGKSSTDGGLGGPVGEAAVWLALCHMKLQITDDRFHRCKLDSITLGIAGVGIGRCLDKAHFYSQTTLYVCKQ